MVTDLKIVRAVPARLVLIAVCFLAAVIASPAQTFYTLASFDGSNGEYPYYGSLVQGANGNLYGTTYYGGSGAYASSLGGGTVKASTFTVVSDTQVNATVPSGAKTGPIVIATPAGTAASAAKFSVT